MAVAPIVRRTFFGALHLSASHKLRIAAHPRGFQRCAILRIGPAGETGTHGQHCQNSYTKTPELRLFSMHFPKLPSRARVRVCYSSMTPNTLEPAPRADDRDLSDKCEKTP